MDTGIETQVFYTVTTSSAAGTTPVVVTSTSGTWFIDDTTSNSADHVQLTAHYTISNNSDGTYTYYTWSPDRTPKTPLQEFTERTWEDKTDAGDL